MPYSYQNRKGHTYYLNSQQVKLRNGQDRQIYFFSRDVREGKTLDALPSGYEVSEGAGSGLPVLKKQK